ncbi:hypothetical protein [Massilia arenae]|uniref:Beta-ketoacyl synthase N-terminal domain-containing protein n=1 Tax=Massilia arenae TaxID=2603288 RepID=A0A5C7FU03_9BURK|nr:hypothetical protein [Massilia arenae]TXF99767.1 hypothetical protein FVD38_11745 [Massilia arenae]
MSTTTTTATPPAPGWLNRIGGRLLARQPVAQAAAAPAVQQEAVQERPCPTLSILAGALCTPHGASAEELDAALAANKVDADLDRDLVDDDGLPVMSARCEQAGDAAVRDEIADWLDSYATPAPRFGDEGWRALVLGTTVLRQLADRAAGLLVADEGAPFRLQLALVLPDDWQVDQRQAASMWCRQLLAQSGWPAARIDVTEPAAPAPLIARMAQQAEKSAAPTATILLAFCSHVGQETVDCWSANGTLFTSFHPRGRIPGEGAAGLLLAPAADGAGIAHLSLEAEACDPTSASLKRLSPQPLNTLAGRLLQGAAITPAAIAMVVADSGADTRHALELMEFGGATTPHLDNASDIVRLGPACGTCGAVPFVAALALAAHAALEHDAPLLCVGNDMPDLRALALVRPAPKLEEAP